MSGTAILVVALAGGIPALVGTILIVVFSAVGRAKARLRAELEREGIVLDSGTRWVTIRFSRFRAPGYYRGAGLLKLRASLVLTQARFVLFPGFRSFYRVARADLGRYAVGMAEDGALELHSDDPPGATGSIDFRVNVDEPNAWVAALSSAGARPLRR